jgi:hypothetical protein
MNHVIIVPHVLKALSFKIMSVNVKIYIIGMILLLCVLNAPSFVSCAMHLMILVVNFVISTASSVKITQFIQMKLAPVLMDSIISKGFAWHVTKPANLALISSFILAQVVKIKF